jgi:colicin import membrane protein
MTDAAPYTVPKEPGRWRAIALAALVHVALITFLWIGVRWQNETPIAVEAEIWTPRAIEAAPRPEPPAPPPPPRPPEPKPVVKEIPKPQPVETPKPPVAKPDIALEQEKKKRKLQEEKAQRLAEEREEERKKLAREKELAEAAKKKELADAAKKKDAAEQEKKEAAAADLKRKQLAEAKRKQQAEAEAKAEAQAAEARRQEDMNRLRNQAQAGTGGAGEAPKAQGSRADASYISRVGAKIKSNTTFNVPDDLPGNPSVEYSVELLPDGSLRGVRKLKGSGVTGFDEAVRRAIERSAPFPPDKSGSVPSGFTVSHKPKDL